MNTISQQEGEAMANNNVAASTLPKSWSDLAEQHGHVKIAHTTTKVPQNLHPYEISRYRWKDPEDIDQVRPTRNAAVRDGFKTRKQKPVRVVTHHSSWEQVLSRYLSALESKKKRVLPEVTINADAITKAFVNSGRTLRALDLSSGRTLARVPSRPLSYSHPYVVHEPELMELGVLRFTGFNEVDEPKPERPPLPLRTFVYLAAVGMTEEARTAVKESFPKEETPREFGWIDAGSPVPRYLITSAPVLDEQTRKELEAEGHVFWNWGLQLPVPPLPVRMSRPFNTQTRERATRQVVIKNRGAQYRPQDFSNGTFRQGRAYRDEVPVIAYNTAKPETFEKITFSDGRVEHNVIDGVRNLKWFHWYLPIKSRPFGIAFPDERLIGSVPGTRVREPRFGIRSLIPAPNPTQPVIVGTDAIITKHGWYWNGNSYVYEGESLRQASALLYGPEEWKYRTVWTLPEPHSVITQLASSYPLGDSIVALPKDHERMQEFDAYKTLLPVKRGVVIEYAAGMTFPYYLKTTQIPQQAPVRSASAPEDRPNHWAEKKKLNLKQAIAYAEQKLKETRVAKRKAPKGDEWAVSSAESKRWNEKMLWRKRLVNLKLLKWEVALRVEASRLRIEQLTAVRSYKAKGKLIHPAARGEDHARVQQAVKDIVKTLGSVYGADSQDATIHPLDAEDVLRSGSVPDGVLEKGSKSPLAPEMAPDHAVLYGGIKRKRGHRPDSGDDFGTGFVIAGTPKSKRGYAVAKKSDRWFVQTKKEENNE
jgi:hypothetical protein